MYKFNFIPNLHVIKKTGQVFATNYVDYHNKVICQGNYQDNTNPLIPFENTREATQEETKAFRQDNKLMQAVQDWK